jgi:membrane associated rhomboid family serine protease
MFNHFSPSHSPLPGRSINISLPSRSRFYHSYSNRATQVSNNMNILYGLMGLNVAIFGYAMYVKQQAMSGFQGPYIKFMRNMSMNLTDVLHNHAYYQLLTSAFTHVEIWHLAGNMLTAYYLGSFLCYAPIITPIRFLQIAIGSGVAGSAGFLWQRYLQTGGKGVDYSRGLGFSGALMGITSVAACLAPTAKVYIYGIIPLPLWATVAGYAAYDGYYLNSTNSRVAHSGHLGGLAFGIAYYLLKLRGLRI